MKNVAPINPVGDYNRTPEPRQDGAPGRTVMERKETIRTKTGSRLSIALAQLNPVVGDLAGNAAKALAGAR